MAADEKGVAKGTKGTKGSKGSKTPIYLTQKPAQKPAQKRSKTGSKLTQILPQINFKKLAVRHQYDKSCF